MREMKKKLLQQLPKVDIVIKDERLKPLITRYPKRMVVEEIRQFLKKIRQDIIDKEDMALTLTYDTIVDQLAAAAAVRLQNSMRRAVNGVGIILHTGLGRAPLSEESQAALLDCIKNYCTLQIDLETGKRGDRYSHVEKLLCQITGSEAAMVVNNNAAATLLVLNSLAQNKEVIVSRGELVEIGGSFRIPDVMERSGAKLVEVGTTNRTHLKDFEAALRPETGCILQVHQSNYTIIGFTKKVELEELAKLAHNHEIPLFHDLGSGALVDFRQWGLPYEPTVQDSIKAGSDIVCFSGDKLLGGPQCGIILGKKAIIDRIKKNQLTRALRCDKLTYAVLEATIRDFLDEKRLLKNNPVIRMLTEPLAEIKKRCMGLKRKIRVAVGESVKLRIIPEFSEVGSGSMSSEKLPTWALSIRLNNLSVEELAARLRLSNPPIIGRVKDDRFLLDCRTIRADEIHFVVDAVATICR
ncbi:MAG: L-seryl-tRNA(Sec) selenium transferase [Chitinivibrionales bacterium]|nr:L-seryl-tRNA(Sec) selenium transferase [Chitinivibrionales bacterium]